MYGKRHCYRKGGVFFKAETILTATGGHLLTAIAAWTVGGLIMIACAYTFSIMATKYEKVKTALWIMQKQLWAKPMLIFWHGS